jgi:IS30 family transposase
MVRRDFPKGESLDAVSPLAVGETQDRLNRLPRRQLKYSTTEEVFIAERARAQRRAQRRAAKSAVAS